MPNYQDFSQDDREFDATEFWNGKAMVRVEGKYWNRHFTQKEDTSKASSLQIHRNYISAVKGMGGTVVFEGDDPEGARILVLKAAKQGKEIWIQIKVESEGFEYRLRMVETEAMKQDVTVSGLMKALETQGRVALDVRFATSKADILPESKSILDQMIALMKENPGLKVSIEGHTDNSGDAKANKGLSERRAQAVVAALKAAGVDPGRMSAAGWGSEKPVADNSSAEGKAQNRRVELVKK
jgi:outer membrane protein OmpA-like peptidoglycan-associated protein